MKDRGPRGVNRPIQPVLPGITAGGRLVADVLGPNATLELISETIGLQLNGTVITIAVKDASIGASKLAPGAVAASVGTLTGDITGDLSGGLTVGASRVVGSMMGPKAATYGKSGVFISTLLTGTGSPQTIPHGLASVPKANSVMVSPTNTTSVGGVYSITEGSHDATNLYITATSGLVYRVSCWLT